MKQTKNEIIRTKDFGAYRIDVVKSITLQPDTIDQILALFDAGYGEKADYSPFIKLLATDRNPQPLTWKITEYPLDASKNIVALAYAKDLMVGFYSFMARASKIGDDIRDLAQANDSVVHPEYRRQHTYVNLVQTLNDTLYDTTGIQLFYAFPNRQNPRVSKKNVFYSKHIYRTPQMTKDAIEGNSVELENLDNLLFSNGNDKQILALWTKMAEEFKWGPVKSADYLKWRYLDNPHNKGLYTILGLGDSALEGVVVTKTFNDVRSGGIIRGHIVDLISPAASVTQELVAGAENYLSKKGAEDCSLFMFNNTIHHKVIRNMGYNDNPLDTYFVIGSANNETLKHIKKGDVHFLQMGDSDTF